MEMPQDDPFMEIMALLRKRNSICMEWMDRIDREVENGDITYDEYMQQAQMIREEMARTDEAFRRQEEYLKNVRIIKD